MSLWLRLDVDFAENKKVAALSDKAFRFHVAGLCYCAQHLTDGHVSARGVRVVAAVLNAPARTAELVESGLWDEDAGGDGFRIHDYLDHQRSADEAKALSAAGRTGANARWNKNRSTNGSAGGNANRNAEVEVQKKKQEPRAHAPEHPTPTWQPAFGVSNPAEAIRRQITNGAIADRVDLEAELAAHPTLGQAERIALIALLDARAA